MSEGDKGLLVGFKSGGAICSAMRQNEYGVSLNVKSYNHLVAKQEVHMASGFFNTVTAVQMDKAISTKDKLLADIELQKQAAQARLDDKPFNPRESERAFSVWFFERQGAWWSYIRAGNTPLHINGGDAFQAGDTLTEVIEWYDKVAASVRAGDLDAELAATMKRRSETMKGRKRSG